MEPVPRGCVANRPADASGDPGPRPPPGLSLDGLARELERRELLRGSHRPASWVGSRWTWCIHTGRLRLSCMGCCFPEDTAGRFVSLCWEQCWAPAPWASSRQMRVEGLGVAGVRLAKERPHWDGPMTGLGGIKVVSVLRCVG